MHISGLLKRWWFWVGAVLAIVVGWYLYGWAAYEIGTATKYGAENAAARAYYRDLEKQKEAYRKDTYGGDTPEETLRLFVEALEKKDFELAAKYFVVEEQQNALRENIAGEQGGNKFFIDAYREGRTVPPGGVGASGIYEIEVFPKGESIAYGVRLIQNEFTGKWKILEL